MATPANFDISWTSGDTEYLELFYNDVNGNPIDLTDVTIAMDIKAKRTDTDGVLTTNYATWDSETGAVLFTFQPYDTSDLMPQNKTKASYYFDVELNTRDNVVTTILSGKIAVTRSITNQY